MRLLYAIVRSCSFVKTGTKAVFARKSWFATDALSRRQRVPGYSNWVGTQSLSCRRQPPTMGSSTDSVVRLSRKHAKVAHQQEPEQVFTRICCVRFSGYIPANAKDLFNQELTLAKAKVRESFFELVPCSIVAVKSQWDARMADLIGVLFSYPLSTERPPAALLSNVKVSPSRPAQSRKSPGWCCLAQRSLEQCCDSCDFNFIS